MYSTVKEEKDNLEYEQVTVVANEPRNETPKKMTMSTVVATNTEPNDDQKLDKAEEPQVEPVE